MKSFAGIGRRLDRSARFQFEDPCDCTLQPLPISLSGHTRPKPRTDDCSLTRHPMEGRWRRSPEARGWGRLPGAGWRFASQMGIIPGISGTGPYRQVLAHTQRFQARIIPSVLSSKGVKKVPKREPAPIPVHGYNIESRALDGSAGGAIRWGKARRSGVAVLGLVERASWEDGTVDAPVLNRDDSLVHHRGEARAVPGPVSHVGCWRGKRPPGPCSRCRRRKGRRH